MSMRPSGLQRKLQAWELDHLRQVLAEQQALIEAQSAAIAVLQRDLARAEDAADRWRDDALQAINAAGCTPGLTQAGQLVALQPTLPAPDVTDSNFAAFDAAQRATGATQ
jgi:hypothetical protein